MSRRGMLTLGLGCWLLVSLPLALLVHAGWAPLQRVDDAVVDALQPRTAGRPALQTVVAVVTDVGTSWFRFVVLLPVVAWAWPTRRRRLAVLLVVAGGLIGPVTSGLKLLVGRERPGFPDQLYASDSLSHPSGHSSGVVTLVALLLLAFLRLQPPQRRRWSVLGGIAVVVLVGLSRVALGAHYPSDVVAGWALGAGWVLVLAALIDAAPPPREEEIDGSSKLHEQQPWRPGGTP